MLWLAAPAESQWPASTNHQVILASGHGPRHHVAKSGVCYPPFLICRLAGMGKWNNMPKKPFERLYKESYYFCGYFYYSVKSYAKLYREKMRSLLSVSSNGQREEQETEKNNK